MRVIHTIASTRVDHGGTSRSVPALCESLAGCGIDVHLVTGIRKGCDYRTPDSCVAFHTVPEARVLGRASLGRGFRQRLKTLVLGHSQACLVHDHGMWLSSNLGVASFCRHHRICRIVAPRGMLSPWSLANSGLKKAIPWCLYQRKDLATATAFHATSQLEADEIRALGFTQPIAVIANGVQRPAQVQTQKAAGRRILFLSRIHPKKGLINLLNAWKVAGMTAEWQLVIAGPDECGHLNEVEQTARRLMISEQVKYVGSVDDELKWQLYADAEVFVLPSFSENFGIVVAEALAAGVPVLTSTKTPWREVIDRKCGWCVEPNVEELADTLRTIALTSADDLVAMGEPGRQWIDECFGWHAIADKMMRFYVWMIQGGMRPDYVC